MAQCFTVEANGIAHAILMPCGFSLPFDGANPPVNLPPVENFIGIMDTGATGTVITQAIVDKLGLVPITMTQVHHAAGTNLAEVYLVSVQLPNAVRFAAMKVTKGILHSGIQALIGMDIITSGDFSITNLDGKTVQSFRYPSSVRTDFVAEQQRATLMPAIKHRHSQRKKKR